MPARLPQCRRCAGRTKNMYVLQFVHPTKPEYVVLTEESNDSEGWVRPGFRLKTIVEYSLVAGREESLPMDRDLESRD